MNPVGLIANITNDAHHQRVKKNSHWPRTQRSVWITALRGNWERENPLPCGQVFFCPEAALYSKGRLERQAMLKRERDILRLEQGPGEEEEAGNKGRRRGERAENMGRLSFMRGKERHSFSGPADSKAWFSVLESNLIRQRNVRRLFAAR